MQFKLLTHHTIGTRVTLCCTLCFVICAGVVAMRTTVIVRNAAVDSALATVKRQLQDQARLVRFHVDNALRAASTVAQTLSALENQAVSRSRFRSEISSILRALLDANPQFLGVFTYWDPGPPDDQDAAHGGADGHGPAGRFMPYWRRTESGEARLGVLSEHEGRIVTDHYEQLRESRRSLVTEPLSSGIEPSQKEFITLVAPIATEEGFHGITGIDLSLDFLHELVLEISSHGGRVQIVSSAGQVLVDNLVHLSDDDGSRGSGPPSSSAREEETPGAAEEDYVCSGLIDLGGGSKPWTALAHLRKSGVISAPLDGSMFWQIAPSLATIAGAFLLLWLYARSITAPLHKTTKTLKSIAQGQADLTQRLEIKTHNEVGQLATWFNAFVSRVHTLVHSTSRAADEVASAAARVAAASQLLSAAITEVASQSAVASEDAMNTGRVAEQGEIVVKQTIEGIHAVNRSVTETSSTIEELSQHCTQIHGIINTIHGVAQQTNLLAVNATIEAARAGEAGRGFAVVADEVKHLARQTTEATRNIETSLQAIHAKTDLVVEQMAHGAEHANSGVEKARLARASLERIVFGTRQFTGVTESISMITNQAKDAVHQAATAAEQLASKAEQLQEQVGKFKL